MKSYIIFYAAPACNSSVTIYAESFAKAYKYAQSFSRSRSVTILGVIDKLYYSKLKFDSHE